MAHCQLGGLRWRVDPTQVSWSYQLDTSVINTLGGQVIQILGATLSDLVIAGDFGHKWGQKATNQDSWQQATDFHHRIKSMMDSQLSVPFMKSATGKRVAAEATWVHKPYTFTYHDGLHDWSFQVLVKDLSDPLEGASLTHTVSRPNYQYQLTLFIVQANSDVVHAIAVDPFIARIAKGVGWKKSSFHGATTAKDVQDIIMANGGSVGSLLAKALGGSALTVPSTTGAPPVAKTKPTPPSGNVGRDRK
jgi:hypothetical protein